MPTPGYQFDAATGRYVRHDVTDPNLAADIPLAPGELANMADGGQLQGILTRARLAASQRLGPSGEADFIKSLWSLHEEGDVLLVRWRSMDGFRRFAADVESAWAAVDKSAFIHFISTEVEPLCWSDSVRNAFDPRYLRGLGKAPLSEDDGES